MTDLEKIFELSSRSNTFLRDFGLELAAVADGRVRLSARVTETVRNNYGFAHGGFLMALADVTAGLTAFTDERRYVTQNSSFQFLSNVRDGQIFAEGTVLHRGNTVCSVRVEITDADGKLLCEGLVSMFAVKMQFQPVE